MYMYIKCFKVFNPTFISSDLLFGRDRPNSTVISQMWQLPLHFQAAPNIFTIIKLKTIVNLNNQSGSQSLTIWLLKYFFRWNCKVLLLQNQWQVTITTQKW